jgi:arsenate reductase
MAEGLVNSYLGHEWSAHSAGTEPTGQVHPLAVAAMAELGIDISQQHSKSVDVFRNAPLELVVTVCDDAAESCPVWLGPERKLHAGFRDPAAATGDREQQLAVFRQVRDEIHQRIFALLSQWATGPGK